MPRRDGWKKDDIGEKQWETSAVALTEYRDGVFYAVKKGRSTWYRIAASEEPFLSFYPTEGLLTKDVGISIDGSESTASYSFKNQSGGTSQYSLTIRRSTGRFTETFSAEGTPDTIQCWNVPHLSLTAALFRRLK
jgi:hypothetical protein